ncbi:MAG: formyltransferase family protein [Caldilineaceae bacterium]
MRVAVLCATRRGYRFLQKLTELYPQCELVVFSFPEEPWEPRFLDDIRQLTECKGGCFYETRQVGSRRLQHFWASTEIDLMFAVSWRYLIPAKVYRQPRLGTFVFHDSLLPAYRGFSPTVWSIINGEPQTGVTLFQIADNVDEGDIVAQQAVPIGPDDTIATVMEEVTQGYLSLLEQNLDKLLCGCAARYPQDHSLATYTGKRLPEDNRIDWYDSTERIYNLIRAVSQPYPGAYTDLCGRRLRVWAAKRLVNQRRYIGSIPGRPVEICPGEGVVVLTGDGSLLLTEVQLDDGEIVCASELINSLSHTLGAGCLTRNLERIAA